MKLLFYDWGGGGNRYFQNLLVIGVHFLWANFIVSVVPTSFSSPSFHPFQPTWGQVPIQQVGQLGECILCLKEYQTG